MNIPEVSIVIPTYNHARFINSALDSVRAQKFINWEVIVVNNFSADNTIELVQKYNDPRIRVVNFANQGIIAASRNYGIALASAPFVAFLDSDDLWYQEKLSYCLEKLAQGYDLVCHDEVWVGPGNRKREVQYGPEKRATFDGLLFDGNCVSTSAVVVRRTWLEKVNQFSTSTDYVTAEDYDLWLKLAFAGAKFGFINKVLGEYLIHHGGESRAVLRNMEAVMAVYSSHKKNLSGDLVSFRNRRREALIYYSGARGLQDAKNYWSAWPYFLKAIRCYPFVAKFYIAMALNFLLLRP